MVGAERFELSTFCTPSKRATSLRYAPTEVKIETEEYQSPAVGARLKAEG